MRTTLWVREGEKNREHAEAALLEALQQAAEVATSSGSLIGNLSERRLPLEMLQFSRNDGGQKVICSSVSEFSSVASGLRAAPRFDSSRK
jgi:hypothetical protein